MEVTTVVEDASRGAVTGRVSKGDWLGIAVFGSLTAVGVCGTASVAGRGVL